MPFSSCECQILLLYTHHHCVPHPVVLVTENFTFLSKADIIQKPSVMGAFNWYPSLVHSTAVVLTASVINSKLAYDSGFC